MDLGFLYGFLGFTVWEYVLVTFIMVQVTVMGVTLYLHRDAAHRSLELRETDANRIGVKGNHGPRRAGP